MNILVINSGSSSIKYQIFDMNNVSAIVHGWIERIGEKQSDVTQRWYDSHGNIQQIHYDEPLADHTQAFKRMLDALQNSGVLNQSNGLAAIGHRVVHGGETFHAATLIDHQVIDAIRQYTALAPLHNPANLTGIDICMTLFPDVPQIAVFDTAFHHTMPPHAYRYAVPKQWYTDHHVRRYGFHGTSHAFVATRAAEQLQRPLNSLNLITLHLGNGASAAAIQAGKCIDTSMGFTPLEGLMMGTRSGDIDPAIPFYLARKTGAPFSELEKGLNRESGLKGVCGNNDMREVQRLAQAGDQDANLALDMYCHRIKKYIGAYYAILGRVDVLVFTAGVGEHAAAVRRNICRGLSHMGIVIDETKNDDAHGPLTEIQGDTGDVKVLVIATNEEMEIARQTKACVAADTIGRT